MRARVSRWGDGLGIRIPRQVAAKAGLSAGMRVEVAAVGDRVVIAPACPRYVLAELLAGIRPEDMRDAFDWGGDLGREEIE
jgi:antitoxin MazE